MKKIIIIGCGGSGKSTLAVKLSKKLNIPVVHLDKLFWRDNWTNTSTEDFDRLLKIEIQKDEWIIDGNYDRTLNMRFLECDTVIYLDYKRSVCIYGAIKRVFLNYGKTRPDMGSNCPEKFDYEFYDFIKWIWNFNKTYRRKYLNILSELNKNIYIFKNKKECQKFLESL